MRLVPFLLIFLLWPPRQDPAALPPPDVQPFDLWLDALVQDAKGRGFSDKLIADTLSGLEPLPRVIDNDRNQAELIPGFDRYYSSRVTRTVVRRGRELAAQHHTLLTSIEKTYGVPRRFVLAIWGMETRYGRNSGSTPVFQALATLAWEPRRSDYFRGELFNALAMVSRGFIESKTMTGSWAGAMGQPQFMPTSYLEYAVDFDGDGRRDIWRSVPDALASIANYLKGYGWDTTQGWGREVRLTPTIRTQIQATVQKRTTGCFAMRNMTERRPVSEWRALAVQSVDGTALPRAMVPAGLALLGERAFLLYPNYDALLGYNCAHYYAVTVALLAERLR